MGDQYLFLKQFSIFLLVSITALVYTVIISFVLQRVIKHSRRFLSTSFLFRSYRIPWQARKTLSVKRILSREREKGSDVAACKLPRNKYEIYEEGDSTLCEVVSTFCQLRYVHQVMLHENSIRMQTQELVKLSH